MSRLFTVYLHCFTYVCNPMYMSYCCCHSSKTHIVQFQPFKGLHISVLCLYYSAKLRVFKCFCLWHLFGSVREEKNLFSLDQCFGYSLPVKTSSAIFCAPHWPVYLKLQHHNRCHPYAGLFS